jgi:hypothetical protein
VAKPKEADAKRASRDAAYPGEIIPEWWAKSSRNAERDQIGMVGDIIPDSRATSPGIRRANAAKLATAARLASAAASKAKRALVLAKEDGG